MKSARNRNVAVGMLFAILLGGFVVYPEVRARMDATGLCESIPVSARMKIDRPALEAMTREYKARYNTLYTTNYFPDEKNTQSGNGAVMFLFLGWFPFGREYCVLSMNKDVVLSKRTLFNADDYTYCDGDVRFISDCSGYRR